jgi:hypothetical protein
LRRTPLGWDFIKEALRKDELVLGVVDSADLLSDGHVVCQVDGGRKVDSQTLEQIVSLREVTVEVAEHGPQLKAFWGQVLSTSPELAGYELLGLFVLSLF